MALIQERDRKTLTDLFAQKLVDPVKLVLFSQRRSPLALPTVHTCEFCEQTEQIATEIGELSDKVTVEIKDFVADEAEVKTYGVDKIPAIAVVGSRDYGVRFYGILAGYEFTSLVEDILDVSRGTTDLSMQAKEQLKKLDKDVHIQVFITPT